MIQVLIFDADGVTIEDHGLFSEYLEKHYSITTEQTKDFFFGVFGDCLIGKADLKTEIKSYLKKWGWKKSLEDFIHEWFLSEHYINRPLIEEIQKLRKRGIRCFLATNQEKYRTAYIMKEMGFSDLFDGIFSSAHLGYKKPQKEFFELVMQSLPGIAKEEVLFLDDTKGHIDAAKAFGWQTGLYTSLENALEDIRMRIF